MLMLREGRIVEVEEQAPTCLESGLAAGDPDALGWYGTQLLAIRWMQGRAGELTELVGKLHSASLGPDSAYTAMASLVLAAGGDLAGARRCLDTVRPRGDDDERLASTWLAMGVVISETRAVAGRPGARGGVGHETAPVRGPGRPHVFARWCVWVRSSGPWACAR